MLGAVSFSRCEDGDMRVVNGSSVLEGRLEVCINNAWGTVCDRGFGSSEARVVCRKINYTSGKSFVF